MIKFELTSTAPQFAKLPVRSSKYSAGYDFFATGEAHILPGDVVIMGTGVKAKMDRDCVLLILPRSSMGIRKGIVLANGTGVIDSDYYNNEDNEGEILIALHNCGKKVVHICTGDKIAQGLFTKYLKCTGDGVRAERKGGIGSTGR